MQGAGEGNSVLPTSNRNFSSVFFEVFMARDRNVYIWQAYVTVMSIVSVACLGALAFVIFQSGTNSKMVDGALDREKKAQESLRTSDSKVQLMEGMLGVKTLSDAEFNQLSTSIPTDEQWNKAIKTYTDNMSLFGPNPSPRNYTNLVGVLVSELRARNTAMDSAAKKEAAFKDDFEFKLAQETKAREAEKQNSLDLSNKRDKELVEYTEKNKEQGEQIASIELNKQNMEKLLNKKNRELTAQLEDSKKKIGEMEKSLDLFRTKLNEIQGEDFQYVQGKITEAASGSGGDLVWINLGRSSGLRPGVKFGVVGSDVSRVANEKPKALIEVIAVEEHLSRCKVLSTRSIILNGDLIYSPAWQPGRSVEFALVGKMDMNGDGNDDRVTLKALIEQNGGKVTVDLPPGGKLSGNSDNKLSVNTRWLVMGEDFKVRGDLTKEDALYAKQRNNLESEAKALGISRINLDKLMGWLRGSGAEVSAMGSAMQAKVLDFRPPPPPSTNSNRVSPIFQNRDGSVNRNSIKPELK